MSDRFKLGIVVPCYNEQDVLPETIRRMSALISRLVTAGKISSDSKVFFVDDGSRDATWAIIENAAQDHHVAGIKLSRNRGHQNALVAGLLTAEGDALVSIDADLQDDLGTIETMVDKFLSGTEIVFGVRRQRESDTAFKRFTAESFYRLMSRLGAESIHNHADYRLMSRRAIESLRQYSEVNLFLRGIVPLLGYKSEIVYYDRASRFAGESKYPLKKMVALALNAITSFSVVPLRVITFIGFAIFLSSMIVTLWTLWAKISGERTVPGGLRRPVDVLPRGHPDTMHRHSGRVSGQDLYRGEGSSSVLYRKECRKEERLARLSTVGYASADPRLFPRSLTDHRRAFMEQAEFDIFADQYSSLHAANIALSGETPDYFAEYKIRDIATEYLRHSKQGRAPPARGRAPPMVLDFGAGVGNSVPFVRKYLPDAQITCLDVSTKSLEICQSRFPGQAKFLPFDGTRIPLRDASVNITFAACVFHHIGHDQHVALLKELRRVLVPSGMAFVFEHNPYNPLTVQAVNTCPFDKNARLISAPAMRHRLRAAGFAEAEIRYRIFFPHFLRKLRPLEKWLTWLPLGAQYYALAIR
ncbi:MAG: glycosyltransferase [Terriglobia bacterium]